MNGINGLITTNFLSRDKYEYSDGIVNILVKLFGHHNLISDEEPSELLFVERKKVQDLIKSLKTIDNYTNGIRYCAKVLFGDKCLPDKEPSVQTNPNFKVGDKVKVISGDHLGEIAMITKVAYDGFCKLSDIDGFFSPIRLKLYTEPSVQGEPMRKVMFKDSYYKEELHGKVGIICSMNEKSECAVAVDNTIYWARESDLAPYTEPEYRNLSQNTANCDKSEDNQLKDNMEEKELNLAELLKGCEGETFYSRAYGELTLNEIVRDDRPNAQEIKLYTPDPFSDRVWFFRDGKKHLNGEVDLWPSRALYEKYPLDAPQAWWEWQESRKSKYIFEIEISSWTDGEDGRENENYEGKKWFKFDSAMELKQAAEAVRRTLEDFHKNHTEQ